MCIRDRGNRGVALYGDKVYVATPDSHVVALNKSDGSVAWDVTIANWEDAYTMTVAPLVVKGNIIVGMSGAEYPTRLWIDALDSETGEQVWRRYTIPGPGEPGHETWGSARAALYGGSSAWITGSYDPELDILYWGVGNPNPDWDGTVRPGDNLYSNSTLALDPDTGAIKFYFQYTPADVWDYDGNNEPILVDYGDEKVWLHGDRNGYLYKIDRTNGRFKYGKEISIVNWSKGFDSTGRPIWNMDKVPTYDYEAKDICPASEGGKWWNPMSVNPVTGWVFVPSREICVDIKSAPLGEGLNPDELTVGKPYWGIGTIGWKTGYGQLVAFDGRTGEKMWVVKDRSPFTSGLLSTRGGLLFAGTPEGEFRAYHQETGEELWSFQTGSGIFGSPSTYTIDGEQFVGKKLIAKGVFKFLDPHEDDDFEGNSSGNQKYFRLCETLGVHATETTQKIDGKDTTVKMLPVLSEDDMTGKPVIAVRLEVPDPPPDGPIQESILPIFGLATRTKGIGNSNGLEIFLSV